MQPDMRYVHKGESPEFFESCKENLPENAKWQDFYENQQLSHCKQELHTHLIVEQSNLCIYCERKLVREDSHIEHVYPKDEHVGYPELAFEYKNLTASCNGDACPIEDREIYKPEDIRSCGHKKDNSLDERLFLNPVKDVDIAEYFEYDKDAGTIKAKEGNKKANYTINLLNLDCTRLNLERRKSVQAVFDILDKSNNPIFRSKDKKEMPFFRISRGRHKM